MEENQNNNEEFDPDNINDLVPSLLGKTEECSKNLSDRVKINGIFSEFDAYIHQNFQKFIQMSQQRYKSIKSGNRLEKKLLSQRPEYADISEQILNNYFYNNNEIEKESKKLLKKITLLTNIINKNKSIGRYFIKWWKLLPDEIEEIVEVNGVKTKTYKKRKINVKRTVKNVETIEEKKISNITNINKPEEDKDITTKYTNMKIEKEESSNIDKSNIVDKEKEIIDKEKEDKTKIYEKESEKEKLKDSKELSNKEDKEIEKM